MAASDKAIEYMHRKRIGMHMIVLNLSLHAEGDMRMNAPWNDQTTIARKSLHSGVEKLGTNKLLLYLSHGVRYGRYLEDGTPPHIIRPKFKKALRFAGAGGFIFARKVNHPGTSPRPVVGPTAEKYKPKLRDAVVKWWGAT